MKGANPQMGKRGRRQRTKVSDSEGEEKEKEREGEDEEEGDGEDLVLHPSALLRAASESWVHLLSLIRGVSEEKAAIISRHFPSLRALTDAYAERTASERTTEAETMLAGLTCGQRKIGERVSRRVYEALYTRGGGGKEEEEKEKEKEGQEH